MKSVKYILDEKWQILLRKAKADLNAATILYRENGIPKEVVMFHLEQVAEKPHIVKLIATFLPNELQMVSSSLNTFLALN